MKLDNWEKVETGWPIEDYMDKINGKKSMFYFIKDEMNEHYSWRINRHIFSNITDHSKFLKMSFKVKILIF